MAACVSALEAELTKALEDTAQLEERNVQLSQQLSELREKVSIEMQLKVGATFFYCLMANHFSCDDESIFFRKASSVEISLVQLQQY